MSSQSIQGDGNLQAGGDLTVFKFEGIQKRPSKVAKVIASLSTKMDQEVPVDFSAISKYRIEDKLEYNNLVKYRPLIDKYGYYGAFVESICSGLDTDRPNSKTRLFEHIKDEYRKLRGGIEKEGEDTLARIRESSDEIIETIFKHLSELVSGAPELSDVDEEDVQAGIYSLIAVAFIECNILERPPKPDHI